MPAARRNLKALALVVTANFFIFVLVQVLWGNGQSKFHGQRGLVPTKPFWKVPVPNKAYWNREQQKFDYLYNPLLTTANGSIAEAPSWLNETVQSNSCEADFRVTAEVQDFDLLPTRFKDFLLYMRCRSYRMVLDQRHVCKRKPFLLLAIKSLTPHFDRRQAIRETWGRVSQFSNHTVSLVFLMGNATSVDHFPDLSKMLRYESAVHKDILLWDYRDTFFNLTVKEVLFLKWFRRRCPKAGFIFKGDDDVFVNTHRILEFLDGLAPAKTKDLFIGDVITNAGPHRDKKLKYFIPESMFVGLYPPYAGGGGFLYSGDLALRLYNTSRQVSLFPIDDVYTGMCLRRLGLAPEGHAGFKTFDIDEKDRESPCVYKGLMLVHSRTPQEMLKIWAWLKDPLLNCQPPTTSAAPLREA